MQIQQVRDTLGDMNEIRFARYREYVEARVEANNAMMALLAGSRLAAHALQLHGDSPHQLPGLFPAVRDIDRFNLPPGRASELLLDADAHLAAVAIPYALALYEAFVKDAALMLKSDGFTFPQDRAALSAGRMHQTLYKAAGVPQPADSVALFHVLRCARNAQIHHAGATTPEVLDAVNSLTGAQRARWEQLTMGETGAMFVNGQLRFTIGHLIAAFAVAKESARHINQLLGQKLSRERWARYAVEDYSAATAHPRNSRQWKRGVLGFARFHYLGGLRLTEDELHHAARAAGIWTTPNW